MSRLAFNRPRLLLALFLLCIPFSSQATSASSAHVYIEPVTYNDNKTILFKTFTRINYSGAAGSEDYRYHWLVISTNGIWDEVLHAAPKKPAKKKWDAKHEGYWKEVRRYNTEFEKDIDWANPPKTLRPLIKKYGFKPRPGFNKNEGQGTVTWSSKGICINDKCTQNPVPQRTLGNKSSSKANTTIDVKGKEIITIESAPIQNIFYHAGVALFRNGNYKVVDGKYEATDGDTIGAEFDFNKSEKNGEMIDYNYIDAISVFSSPLTSVAP